jgi:hypothetical protein
MAVLKRATSLGFRNPNIDGDQDLNSLRNRPDFRLLMLDMAFPANPFVSH